MNNEITLVFVYNANSGLLNMLKDAVHKTFAPATYPCKLCDITYSPVRMRSQWKNFVRDLPYAVEFSYIDLIEKKYHLKDVAYPSAWLKQNGKLTTWLTTAELNNCATLDQLQQLVLERLPQTQAQTPISSQTINT